MNFICYSLLAKPVGKPVVTSEQTNYNGLFYMSQKQLPEGVPQPSSISRRDFITGVKMEILCVFLKSPLSNCFSSVKQEHIYRILK